MAHGATRDLFARNAALYGAVKIRLVPLDLPALAPFSGRTPLILAACATHPNGYTICVATLHHNP